jgi:hypothetical protein
MTSSKISIPSPEDYVDASQAGLTDQQLSPTHFEDPTPQSIPTRIRMEEKTVSEFPSSSENDANIHNASTETELMARDASSLSLV